MSFFLRLFGGVILFVGIAGVCITALMVFVVLAKPEAQTPPWAATLFASLGALYLWAGVLVTGTILYVGGRALNYMDAQSSRPRRQSRYADRGRARRRSSGRRIDRPRR